MSNLASSPLLHAIRGVVATVLILAGYRALSGYLLLCIRHIHKACVIIVNMVSSASAAMNSSGCVRESSKLHYYFLTHTQQALLQWCAHNLQQGCVAMISATWCVGTKSRAFLSIAGLQSLIRLDCVCMENSLEGPTCAHVADICIMLSARQSR